MNRRWTVGHGVCHSFNQSNNILKLLVSYIFKGALMQMVRRGIFGYLVAPLFRGHRAYHECFQDLITIVGRCSVLGVFIALAGCSTPSFVTTRHSTGILDEPIKDLALIQVQGRFPDSITRQANKGEEFGDVSWHQGVGERLEQTFRHNGVNLSAVGKDGRYVVEGVPIYSKEKPTLVLKSTQLSMRNGIPIQLLYEAQLWIPGQTKPIWEGVTWAAIFQAADEMSIKLINELTKLKLLAPNRAPAETLGGKKNATFGGVLAP